DAGATWVNAGNDLPPIDLTVTEDDTPGNSGSGTGDPEVTDTFIFNFDSKGVSQIQKKAVTADVQNIIFDELALRGDQSDTFDADITNDIDNTLVEMQEVEPYTDDYALALAV
ncbi:MAG: hypothetical protein GY761_05835, partial [Hyphomicrobiales bacterium]|nr:hypothetical protein [Hyphomicrobiales bacterium]